MLFANIVAGAIDLTKRQIGIKTFDETEESRVAVSQLLRVLLQLDNKDSGERTEAHR
jgi:hypothetical protein